MMQTGIKKLDDILGGGIKSGIITDVFGASSTGKTQLTLQIMANALQDGKRIFYQDTNGSFRPERLLEMLVARNLDAHLLDNVAVSRPTNTREQMDGIKTLQSQNFDFCIIDNVTDLFSFEYSKEEQLMERTRQFSKYMKSLSGVASQMQIPIIVVNMIRKIDQIERENLDSIISIFTHVKIRLEKKQSGYEGKVITWAKTSSFSYQITKMGLIDAG